MKISVFLIIVFTQFVFCCSLNATDDSYECPIDRFGRRKRALEYTRWRANLESSPEFIVKVLDDEVPRPPKKIVAVNIQPVTKGVEKIIIGGVMVTLPILKSTALVGEMDTMKDYTRFMPPATEASQDGGNPIQRQLEKLSNIPRARNPQRDESPPSNPQFLPRMPLGKARQYAPITPVGFTRRAQMSPLTPPLDQPLARNFLHRTTPFEDVFIPTRTTAELETINHFHAFEPDRDIHKPTSYEPETVFEILYETSNTPVSDPDILQTTEKLDYGDKTNKHKERDTEDGLFYHYEDDNDTKKARPDFFYAYDTKHKPSREGESVSEDDMNIQKARSKETDVLPSNSLDEAAAENISGVSHFRTSAANNEYNDILEQNSRFESGSKFDLTTSSSQEKQLEKSLVYKSRNKRHQTCSMVKLRDLNFKSPRTLPEIVTKLKQWAEESPVAKWVDITDGNLTAMENPIYMMMVDDPSRGQIVSAKQTVVIVAGIQGRDHHAVASAMYVLYLLIERTAAQADLLTKFRFWIIPVLNPDGYDFSMTFPKRRQWAKNLRQNWEVCKGKSSCQSCESFGVRCSIQPCYGVNLDRNFEYQWIPAEELRMEHPCGTLYAGSRQLSEPETSAFVNYLHSQHTTIHLFIAFKEGDVLGVMYPYSHTKKKRAYEPVYNNRASRAAAAASSISGRKYVAGQTSQFLPLYAGGIEDWVDGHLGVDNTYTIMMYRSPDSANYLTNTERIVHEAYAAMDTLVLQSLEKPSVLRDVQMVSIVKSDQKSNSQRRESSISIILLLSTSVIRICAS